MNEKFFPGDMEEAYDPTGDALAEAQKEVQTRRDYLIRLRRSQVMAQTSLDGTTDGSKRAQLETELREIGEQILKARREYDSARQNRQKIEAKLDREDDIITLHEEKRSGHDD